MRSCLPTPSQPNLLPSVRSYRSRWVRREVGGTVSLESSNDSKDYYLTIERSFDAKTYM